MIININNVIIITNTPKTAITMTVFIINALSPLSLPSVITPTLLIFSSPQLSLPFLSSTFPPSHHYLVIKAIMITTTTSNSSTMHFTARWHHHHHHHHTSYVCEQVDALFFFLSGSASFKIHGDGRDSLILPSQLFFTPTVQEGTSKYMCAWGGWGGGEHGVCGFRGVSERRMAGGRES